MGSRRLHGRKFPLRDTGAPLVIWVMLGGDRQRRHPDSPELTRRSVYGTPKSYSNSRYMYLCMYIHARRGIYQDRSKTASPQLPVIKGSASPHGLRASVISFRRHRSFGVSARLGLFARKLLVAVICTYELRTCGVWTPRKSRG
jgi:hypothetical protein